MSARQIPEDEQRRLREDFARVFGDIPKPLPPEQMAEADEAQKRG